MPLSAFCPCDASQNELVRSHKVKNVFGFEPPSSGPCSAFCDVSFSGGIAKGPASFPQLSAPSSVRVFPYLSLSLGYTLEPKGRDRRRKHSFVNNILDTTLRQRHISSHCWAVQRVSSRVGGSAVSLTIFTVQPCRRWTSQAILNCIYNEAVPSSECIKGAFHSDFEQV